MLERCGVCCNALWACVSEGGRVCAGFIERKLRLHIPPVARCRLLSSRAVRKTRENARTFSSVPSLVLLLFRPVWVDFGGVPTPGTQWAPKGSRRRIFIDFFYFLGCLLGALGGPREQFGSILGGVPAPGAQSAPQGVPGARRRRFFINRGVPLGSPGAPRRAFLPILTPFRAHFGDLGLHFSRSVEIVKNVTPLAR